MASRKTRLGAYLEWHRGLIRVTVPVPKALQSSIGTTRLKRSLHTDSPANAERVKHAVIHELKAIIATADKPREGLVAEAMGWRQDLDALGERERETLELVMVDRAEEIEAKEGLPAAREFVAIANGDATPIDTLLDTYLASCGLKERTQDSVRRSVRTYEEWASANGEPLAIENISRKVAGRFVSGHLLPRMEPQSAGSYTKFLSGYWRFLKGKGYVEENPWTGQLEGVKRDRKRRSILLDTEANGSGGKRPYTDEEAHTLLYAQAENETDRRTLDLVWIGALSGMRIEEICGLRVRDCQGGWFDVNADGKGKTAAAKRRVPIHPDLASIVAKRCADKKPEGYLIHELKDPPKGSNRERSMPASKAYTRFRRRLGIDERVEGQRQSNVDFHSWRRWFIRKARDARQGPWTIADVVGHDTKDLPLGLTMGGYPGRADDKALQECIAAVKLPELEALAA
jgi:integrase